MANPGNVAGGYKATLNNPNVSDEAKQHAQEMLDSGDFESAPSSSKHDDSMKNTGNVIGGYKATLNNPNVSDEAKEHAQEKLDELGA
ncbi:conidiation-specific protein 6 [Saitoella complicata NRRL Y-17804]|nr:conidiation-specific protein 6 [Saitoella complicata NRRL Y-17804]ODQ56120.1 conidiation-specific protein 6 [Saitoella complicata NRRL Y-17804]